MTTAKTKQTRAERPSVPTDAFKSYLDVLLESHAKFATAVKGARTRTARVNDQILDSVVSSQRTALELSKRFVDNPTDVASNMKAAMEIASSAQANAVELARLLFREQAAFSQELRQNLASLVPAGKDLGQAFSGFKGFPTPWLKKAA